MPKFESLIRDVPDFPKAGILFKDITPVLADPAAFAEVIEALAVLSRASGATRIAGIESRGFIFGAPLAQSLGIGFVPIRKAGKLPYEKVSVTYDLEYGSDTLEMHVDAVTPEDKVLVIDDLLATGGTAAATGELIQSQKASVCAYAFVIELGFLEGRARLAPTPVHSLLCYS